MDLFGRKARKKLEATEKALFRSVEINSILFKKLDDLTDEKKGLEQRLLVAQERTNQLADSRRLYVDDDQAELEWRYRTGDIDLTEFRNLLKAQGFENTEIDLAPHTGPENLTY